MLKTVINCHMRTRGLQNQTEKYHVQCCQIIFILLCLIFPWFLILFIYIINIGYWQVLFITQEQLGKSQFATSTFKCRGSTAAVLIYKSCCDKCSPKTKLFAKQSRDTMQKDHIYHTKQYQTLYRKIKCDILNFRGMKNGCHQDFQYLMVSIHFFS